MRNTLPGAVAPLAAIPLLARANMVIVEVVDELVHVLQIASFAAFPLAHGHLVLAELIEILRHARMVVRRRRHRAVRVICALVVKRARGDSGAGVCWNGGRDRVSAPCCAVCRP
jgi:hypothetical protein